MRRPRRNHTAAFKAQVALKGTEGERVHLLALDRARRKAIAAFNAKSPVLKKGVALTPVKFGISFTAQLYNQAGALVLVYRDGTAQVNHGGTEMGQGLFTKILQIAADGLGVGIDQVRVMSTRTDKIPNTSATAASSASGSRVPGGVHNVRRR